MREAAGPDRRPLDRRRARDDDPALLVRALCVCEAGRPVAEDDAHPARPGRALRRMR
jgi:hypothetical protein